jgi:hypothetical protein
MAQTASAIEITVVKSQGENPSIVLLEGSFVGGDYAKFAAATQRLSPGTVVMLNSGGGELPQVIQIGEMIREKKFVTIAGSICTSGCAFVWLAGAERFAYDNSYIGVHGSFKGNTGQVSADGIASLAAYLARLGFGSDAISYLTKAVPIPAMMEWLDFDTARHLGIHVQRQEGTLPRTSNLGFGCPMSKPSPCEIPIPEGPFPDVLKNYRPAWK